MGHLGSPLLALLAFSLPTLAAQSLSLNPQNPHYFLFRGKPTVLISSGEHYGAVLNLDFDFSKYLDTLAGDGLNLTRTWAGAYCEPPSAFNIRSNTLAPLRGRLLCPWARSAQPGYANGGNKFDLSRWDDAYFNRLKQFLSRASQRGVVVELNLFCPFYEESMWQLSPMNAANNINGIGAVDRTNVYTLDRNDGLLLVQEAMVRKLVTELKGFDNLYYEICNEPYFGGVTLEWQHHMADVIAGTGKNLGVRHLISQNIANFKAQIHEPHPGVSIFNFHYATPPDTVSVNYELNKVIGDNETGFRGTNDSVYRMEGWDFIIAGGGLFNNLDYSFVAGHEDGTFVYPSSQPGGGSVALRHQYGFLRETINRFDFVDMHPDNRIVSAVLPPGAGVRALVQPGKAFLIYVRTGLGERKTDQQTRFSPGELSLQLHLPPGVYRAEWLVPASGRRLSREQFHVATSTALTLPVPAFVDDILLTGQRE